VFTLHLELLSFLKSFCQKKCFPEKEFSNEIFWKNIYCTYNCPNMSYFYSQSNLNIYDFLKVHRFCQILCFVLKNWHNFKSYQNMLTFSILIFLYYNLQIFFKQHIHCITFTCCKRLMNILKTLNLINTKLKKYENLIVFQSFLVLPYYYKKHWGWNKLYYEN